MKTVLAALFVFCATAAFGQVGGAIPAQVQPFHISENPQHASPHALATEQPLIGAGGDTYSYAQGERPLWEFGPVSQPVPLGDIARAVRKEKLVAKKAQRVLEKQGS